MHIYFQYFSFASTWAFTVNTFARLVNRNTLSDKNALNWINPTDRKWLGWTRAGRATRKKRVNGLKNIHLRSCFMYLLIYKCSCYVRSCEMQRVKWYIDAWFTWMLIFATAITAEKILSDRSLRFEPKLINILFYFFQMKCG